MLPLPITYKKVLDRSGNTEFLEVWQGDQHLTLSLAGPGTQLNYYRWIEVKDTIDKIRGTATADATQDVIKWMKEKQRETN